MDHIVELKRFHEVREALVNDALTRSIDYERFERGNITEGNLTHLHGEEHRDRRRIENVYFRKESLIWLDKEVIPEAIVNSLQYVENGEQDLISIGRLVATNVAARIVGLDFEQLSLDERHELVEMIEDLGIGAAIDTVPAADIEKVNHSANSALGRFVEKYLRPLEPAGGGSNTFHPDSVTERRLLGALYGHVGQFGLDHETVHREIVMHFLAATHTSSQTLVNTIHELFAWVDENPEHSYQIEDLEFTRRCVHEALRLTPTNPKLLRRAVSDTVVAGREVKAGTILHLNTYDANRDLAVFGADASSFDPNRNLDQGIPRYGMSFGGGMHQCMGRIVAVGTPIALGSGVAERLDIVGLVPRMASAVIGRGVRRAEENSPRRETSTGRWTRWEIYPVRLEGVSESA